MSDRAHTDEPNTPPALRDCPLEAVHSGKLRVQNTPRESIPAVPKRQDEVGEISSLVAGKHAGYVFEEDVSRPYFSDKPDKVEAEA
jgi:hypothetical protein